MTQEALKLSQEALAGLKDVEKQVRELVAENRALKEALAQTQEPVAWLQIGLAPLHDGDVIARTSKPTKWNSEWWRFEPLYTTPPQRTWVGLDHQDKKKFSSWLDHKTDDEVFTAIDDLLREMNT